MSQDYQQYAPEDAEPGHSGAGQQQQQPQADRHGGHGSESLLKQLREWEQRRANDSVGKRRQGPE